MTDQDPQTGIPDPNSTHVERAIRAEIEVHTPGTADDLANEISEAVMDCEFAEQGGDLTSLRLGRLIRTESPDEP